MLGLAEYRGAAAQLLALGQKYEADIAQNVTPEMTKQQQIAYVRHLALQYVTEYQELLDETLREIASNAVDYYAERLNVDVNKDQLVDMIVKQQYTEKYYGASLNQRLLYNERALTRRVVQSAQLGPAALAKVFTSSVPFGAQVNVDKRVLLGTAAKIENDVAKEMASQAGVRLVRWTLSPRHSITCACDDLASAIDGRVVRYIEENKLNINPRGVYFVENLPKPPHPNCQCEYAMVVSGRIQQRKAIRRAVERVRKIIRRLRKR